MSGLRSKLAQAVLDALTRSGPSTARRRALYALRRLWISAHDPTVSYRLGGVDLLLPFSSQIPVYSSQLPGYGENVGRIAGHVYRMRPELTVVDIGANVGDTAAIIRAHAPVPILCVEGEPGFFHLLEENAKRIGPDIELAECFVGPASAAPTLIQRGGGTARLVETGIGEAIELRSLGAVLSEHPRFTTAGMLKLDTDGMDCAILRAELALLERLRPVLFFEYDPDLSARAGTDALETLRALFGIGYRDVLVYDNSGALMLCANLGDTALIEDLHRYFSGHGGSRYADLCAFHGADSDLAVTIGDRERTHAGAGRRPAIQ